MRFKVAPPPRSRAFLADVQAAVPLLPDDESDCCRAIIEATDLADRERAREFLTFARALGLVAESERGYHRTRAEADRERLAEAFRERVFGAAELLDALSREPLTDEAAFAVLREAVPRWERERTADWESVWRTRTERLLAWAVEFGLAERDGEAYVRA